MDDLNSDSHPYYRETWRYSNGWPKGRQLTDAEVASIRANLPFGPLSPDEAETLARQLGVNPITVLNIATGQSFLRIAACPKDHPLRLALNAENARKARIRYQAKKHHQLIGDAQGWKCRYCGSDISGKGQAQLDHIVPVAHGGASDFENLQMLCRRCNIRKGAKPDGDQLVQYMSRKSSQDQAFESINREIPPIADALVWPDSEIAHCLWCSSEATLVEAYDFPQSAVFSCRSCERMFMNSSYTAKVELFEGLADAIFGRWYVQPEFTQLLQEAIEGDSQKARDLLQEMCGPIVEVRHRAHSHENDDSCWCEFGGSEFTFLAVYDQAGTLIENLPDKRGAL